MKYHSTRNNKLSMPSMEVIKQGLSREGGLFVPESIPKINRKELEDLIPADYQQRAETILSMYLTDYSKSQLAHCIDNAYADQFSSPAIAPVTPLEQELYVLELWHGPTCAFKDMALQILPHLMTRAIQSTGDKREIIILTATSEIRERRLWKDSGCSRHRYSGVLSCGRCQFHAEAADGNTGR